MSAATGLARTEDGFDKLLKLANLNAKDIAAAGEEHRRQLQLTADEQARVSAARAYIANHTSLAADLQRREDELAASKCAHEKAATDFANHVASENSRLEAFSLSLDARQSALAASEARHAEELKGFSGLKASHDLEHRNAMAEVKIASNTNIEIGKKLATEEQRLKEWEATLKGKAERIRQQAAAF